MDNFLSELLLNRGGAFFDSGPRLRTLSEKRIHVCAACLPVWLKYPHHLPASSAAAEAEISACLERCLRIDDCIGVDVMRDDDDDDDDKKSLCSYHHSDLAVTRLLPRTTRYQLLDRCYTGTYLRQSM